MTEPKSVVLPLHHRAVHPFLPFFLGFDNGGLGQVRSFFWFGAICSDSAGKSVRNPAGLFGLGKF